MLSAPGHGGADPVAARRQLSDLLARPELLLPAERALATMSLRGVDERLVLLAENRRLQQEAAVRDKDRTSAANKRLQAEIDENARLRRALDEAQKKLDAVSQLERSIVERGGTQPKP
jgi:small-conductance mechanosensitive channel